MMSREEKHELFRRVAWEVKFKEHKEITRTEPGTYVSKVTVTVVTDKGEWPVKPGHPIRFDDPIELHAGVTQISWERVKDIKIG